MSCSVPGGCYCNVIALSRDPCLKRDVANHRWKLQSAGVFIMPKEQQKKLQGHSPDDRDACCLANIAVTKNEQWEALMQDAGSDRYAEL